MGDLPEHIRQALEKEQAYEAEPWLFIPKDICGIEVYDLSLRHVLILDGIKNPLLDGSAFEVDDLAQFLWVVSTEFELSNDKKRDKFLRKIAGFSYPEILKEATEYIEASLAQGKAMQTNEANKKSNAHFVAYVVDTFAGTYGYSIEYILSLPVAIIHQLITVINERVSASNGETYTITKESDKLINRHIRKQLKS